MGLIHFWDRPIFQRFPVSNQWYYPGEELGDISRVITILKNTCRIKTASLPVLN
jgi:hypothetical protein